MQNKRGLAGIAALIAVAIAVAVGVIVTDGIHRGKPEQSAKSEPYRHTPYQP